LAHKEDGPGRPVSDEEEEGAVEHDFGFGHTRHLLVSIGMIAASAVSSYAIYGYTVTYAIANVLLPLLGPIFVAAFAAISANPNR